MVEVINIPSMLTPNVDWFWSDALPFDGYYEQHNVILWGKYDIARN